MCPFFLSICVIFLKVAAKLKNSRKNPENFQIWKSVLEGNFVSTIVGQANLVRLATLGNVHLSHPTPEAFGKNV